MTKHLSLFGGSDQNTRQLTRASRQELKARRQAGFLDAAKARLEADVSAYRISELKRLTEGAVVADVEMHRAASVAVGFAPSAGASVMTLLNAGEFAFTNEILDCAERMRS